jgi:hypothetical protein
VSVQGIVSTPFGAVRVETTVCGVVDADGGVQIDASVAPDAFVPDDGSLALDASRPAVRDQGRIGGGYLGCGAAPSGGGAHGVVMAAWALVALATCRRCRR